MSNYTLWKSVHLFAWGGSTAINLPLLCKIPQMPYHPLPLSPSWDFWGFMLPYFRGPHSAPHYKKSEKRCQEFYTDQTHHNGALHRERQLFPFLSTQVNSSTSYLYAQGTITLSDLPEHRTQKLVSWGIKKGKKELFYTSSSLILSLDLRYIGWNKFYFDIQGRTKNLEFI